MIKVGDIVRTKKNSKYPEFTKQWCKIAEVKTGAKHLHGKLALFPLNVDPNKSTNYWIIYYKDLEIQVPNKYTQLSLF